MHSATRAARTRREKAAADAVLDVARKSGWHELSELIGLKGSHLLSWEETYLGDRRLIDVRGTGQRATSLAGEDLAERIAELELLPRGRVEVYPDRIAGRLWIDVRRRDPWRRPVMHPCASGQHDPAAEFAEHVPQQATCREPLAIGIDPETGRPMPVTLWASGGAKVISITAKKEGGKTTLLDSLKERITACDDALLLQVNLSKALEDRWWAPAAAASALDGDVARAMMILQFTADLITIRPRGDRATRVHQPTPQAPLWVLLIDEVDAVAGIPEAKVLLQRISSKCRSEGVALILAGQRNTAQWTGGGDVQANVDVAIWGKFARDARERGHVAGANAGLPSMSEYGEGHPGVFGVTDLPYQGDHDKGRTFYWGEDSGNIRRLIAARAAHRGPVRLDRRCGPCSRCGTPSPAPPPPATAWRTWTSRRRTRRPRPPGTRPPTCRCLAAATPSPAPPASPPGPARPWTHLAPATTSSPRCRPSRPSSGPRPAPSGRRRPSRRTTAPSPCQTPRSPS